MDTGVGDKKATSRAGGRLDWRESSGSLGALGL